MIKPFWLLFVLPVAKANIHQVIGFAGVAFVRGFGINGIGSFVMPFLPRVSHGILADDG